jgi:myo-inositol-1(or 4)-monophosphatase
VDDEELVDLCHRVADAVEQSLGGVEDLRASGGRPGQYALDLVADRAALEVLSDSDIGVLSEESGLHRPGSSIVAILDPVDGSTNASRGIPWYATSICMIDADGPRVGVVANLATKERYQSVRGGGAWKDGRRLAPSRCTELRKAIVALSGYPRRHLGWAQFRAFGSAALELCMVAEGTIDAFMVGGGAHLAPWDYMGGLLLCTEAGAATGELDGRELVVSDPAARRAVASAATPALFEELRTAAAS